MQPVIEFLEWDSTFFKRKIGRITLEEKTRSINTILRIAKKEGFDLIYLFSTFKLVHNNKLLSDYRYSIHDRKVVYTQDLHELNTLFPENVFEYKSMTPDSTLEKLAYESGRFSRFRLDSNFSNNDFKNLYKCWIEKSVNGELANKVYIYSIKSTITGMVTLKTDDKEAKIGLIAVNPSFQGMGFGKALISASLFESQHAGCKKLSIPTQQENKIACRFYEKCGFKIKSITNIYHFWL